MPPEPFGRFTAAVPPPLSIGSVRLADGRWVKGFLVEAEAVHGARDISGFGGWRAFMAQAAACRMVAAGREGAIVNISSILGYRVTPWNSAYCVTKAAVTQMTAALALELARHKIRVNAIAPGYITTEMTEAYLASEISEKTRKAIPQQRVGEPSDLDGALLLLASRKASGYMTGSTIVVDGGHMCSFI